VWLAVLACAATAWGRELALDKYVAKPDPAYRFELANTVQGKGYTVYILKMASQRWLTKKEVDRPLWEHWVNIVVPDKVRYSTGLLFISGGKNGGDVPRSVDEMFRRIAVTTGAVVAELRMVPNQPLVFAGDGRERVEDEIISYAWAKYLRSRDPKWLPRLPMTKSAVRAMDAVTAFCRGKHVAVEKFIVAGASKRGWTTWTTAAVDHRVVAIAPMVIDILNLEPSMIHHYRAYGFWAPAVGDYERAGVMGRLGTDAFHSLLKQVDPYEFRDRFTMPKYLICAAGDQFFLPDSSQFYFDKLPGEKYIRYIPNTDHSLDGSDAVEAFTAWMQSILAGAPRPRFSWKLAADGSIIVTVRDKPTHVKLWQATDPKARDFRLETIGKAYKATELKPGADGRYIGRVAKPASGWTAFFVELTYPGQGKLPLKFTTQVRVTPDTLPHAAPQPKQKQAARR